LRTCLIYFAFSSIVSAWTLGYFSIFQYVRHFGFYIIIHSNIKKYDQFRSMCAYLLYFYPFCYAFSCFLATQMTDSIKKDFRSMFFYRKSLFSYAYFAFFSLFDHYRLFGRCLIADFRTSKDQIVLFCYVFVAFVS